MQRSRGKNLKHMKRLYKTNYHRGTPYNALKSFSDQDVSSTVIYDKSSYHISAAKCPRCGDCGELVEDGPIRTLYECQNCGIFSKIKPKKRLHGLRQSIAQGELTTALEILEVAGHKDQDAIDALNLYRGVVSHA